MGVTWHGMLLTWCSDVYYLSGSIDADFGVWDSGVVEYLDWYLVHITPRHKSEGGGGRSR